jgi:hypothetical protein
MSDLSKINWSGPQPVPKELAKRLKDNFPQISQTGIYNDRNIAGTQKKSAHAEGRALDIHLNAFKPEQRMLGDQLFKVLIRKASALDINNVIWNRQIWSQNKGGPRAYTGNSPHTDHIHVDFTREGSQNLHSIRKIEIDIAIIRTGIEDLQRGRQNIG